LTLYHRAAVYVDRILKGARPPTSPWSSPRSSSWSSKAKALGLNPAVAPAAADQIIEWGEDCA
jgi:hypothetical protein